jgi:hypothetical protein
MTLSHAEYQAIAAMLTPNGQAFIDGQFCDAADGDKFESTNPATGQVLAEVAHCKATDVDRAVAAARRVFNEGTWSRAEPEERKEVLLKVAQLVREKILMSWQFWKVWIRAKPSMTVWMKSAARCPTFSSGMPSLQIRPLEKSRPQALGQWP